MQSHLNPFTVADVSRFCRKLPESVSVCILALENQFAKDKKKIPTSNRNMFTNLKLRNMRVIKKRVSEAHNTVLMCESQETG